MSPVKTLDNFTALAEAQKYHHLWLVRGIAYGERVAAGRPSQILSVAFISERPHAYTEREALRPA